jgi:hypothetical protein
LRPARFAESIRIRLDQLSSAASDAITVASVLGRRFSMRELAGVLGRSLVGMLQALEGDLLKEDGEKLAFRHDLIRDAVRDVLPKPMRDARHRQAADVLLAGGGSPAQTAVHLAESAQPGDRVPAKPTKPVYRIGADNHGGRRRGPG